MLKDNKTFYVLINDLFRKIEDNLNLYDNEIDIDYQIQDYVLTITFSDKSTIVINKQEALKQVWLATQINGYHFNYKNKKNKWICNRTHQDFWKIFENACSIQSNKKLIFNC